MELFADSDVSRHIKCTVLQQEGARVGGKKQTRKVHKKVLTENHQLLPNTSKYASISFGNYRILPILFFW